MICSKKICKCDVDYYASLTTTDNSTNLLISIPMPAVAATYQVHARLKGYAVNGSSDSVGIGYSFYATYTSDSSSLDLIDFDFYINEDLDFVTAIAYPSESGNDIIFNVKGVTGLTINWFIQVNIL